MEIPSPTSPARLYALLLRLRPLQQGTLMPFSDELVPGAFLSWLRAAAPEVVDWLHDGHRRRLFTCSSLHFSPSMQPHLRAEREHIHLPLDPHKTCTVRLTLLLGKLFPLFSSALTQFSVSGQGARSLPFIQPGKQPFLLEEVLLTTEEATGWTGFTSLAALVEQAQQQRFGREGTLTLEVASLTSFSRGNKRTGYGAHEVMLPLPQFVFSSLLRRGGDIAPPELAHVVRRERVEASLEEDGITIIDDDLTAQHVHLTTHRLRGLVGTCTYQLRGPDEPTSSDSPLTVRQRLSLLALLAFYSGVGHKTAMGLGQARLGACAGSHRSEKTRRALS